MARGPRILRRLADGPGALPRAVRGTKNQQQVARIAAEHARAARTALAEIEADAGLNEHGRQTKRAGVAAIHRERIERLRAEIVESDRYGVMRGADLPRSTWRTASTRILADIPIGRQVAAALALPKMAELPRDLRERAIENMVASGDFATLEAIANAPILLDIPKPIRDLAAEGAHRAAAPELARAYEAEVLRAEEIKGAFDLLLEDLDAIGSGRRSLDGDPDIAVAREMDRLDEELGPVEGIEPWFPTDPDDPAAPMSGVERITHARTVAARKAAAAAAPETA
jgi:hypothetical protein